MADSRWWYARVDKIQDTAYGIMTDSIEKELFIRGGESDCREAVLNLLNTGVYDQGEMTDDGTDFSINWQGCPQESAPKDWTRETMFYDELVQSGMNKGFRHYREEHTNGQTVTRNVLTGKIVDSVGD
jgi:hypothetical protein